MEIMPSGLQVWNDDGQILLDYTDKVLNLLGATSINVPANAEDAGGTIDAGTTQGDFFFFVVPASQYAASGKMPTVTHDAAYGRITWQQPNTKNVNSRTYTIFWGFY